MDANLRDQAGKIVNPDEHGWFPNDDSFVVGCIHWLRWSHQALTICCDKDFAVEVEWEWIEDGLRQSDLRSADNLADALARAVIASGEEG